MYWMKKFPHPQKVIDVHIDVVANHKGFFYFQLCPHNDPDSAATRACFEENRLTYEDGTDRWYIPQGRFVTLTSQKSTHWHSY